MERTKEKAKELTLLKWEWLYNNPEYDVMYQYMPYEGETRHFIYYIDDDIKKKLDYLVELSYCGLCGYQEIQSDVYNLQQGSCGGCILNELGNKCHNNDSWFNKYQLARTKKTRKKYAKKIIDAVKGW